MIRFEKTYDTMKVYDHNYNFYVGVEMKGKT